MDESTPRAIAALRVLLRKFRLLPELWDAWHQHYGEVARVRAGYAALRRIIRTIDPTADTGNVFSRIRELITAFAAECNEDDDDGDGLQRRACGSRAWYAEELQFLVHARLVGNNAVPYTAGLPWLQAPLGADPLDTIAKGELDLQLKILDMKEDPLRTSSWLIEQGMLRRTNDCPKCLCEMVIRKRDAAELRWRCMRRGCTGTKTIRYGSIFFASTCTLGALLHLLLEWAKEASVKEACAATGLCINTVQPWCQRIRDFLFEFEFQEGKYRIGGPGKTVEIGYTKVIRRNFHGNPVRCTQDEWLVAGICKETGDVFLERVLDRKEATVSALLARRVTDGSRVVADCGGNFDAGLPERRANRSDSRAQQLLKDFLSRKVKKHEYKYDTHIAEWYFRRKHAANVFTSLCNAIARQTEEGL